MGDYDERDTVDQCNYSCRYITSACVRRWRTSRSYQYTMNAIIAWPIIVIKMPEIGVIIHVDAQRAHISGNDTHHGSYQWPYLAVMKSIHDECHPYVDDYGERDTIDRCSYPGRCAASAWVRRWRTSRIRSGRGKCNYSVSFFKRLSIKKTEYIFCTFSSKID